MTQSPRLKAYHVFAINNNGNPKLSGYCLADSNKKAQEKAELKFNSLADCKYKSSEIKEFKAERCIALDKDFVYFSGADTDFFYVDVIDVKTFSKLHSLGLIRVALENGKVITHSFSEPQPTKKKPSRS